MATSAFLMYLSLFRVRENSELDLIPLTFPFFRMRILYDLIFMYFVMPFLVLLVGLFFDKLLARAYVGIHKRITFKRNDYFIVESVSKFELSGSGMVSRVIIPAFFSLSLGFLLVGLFPDRLFFSPMGGQTPVDFNLQGDGWVLRFQAIFYASIMTLPLSYLLFSPLWLLDDAGVTFFHKIRQRETVHIQGVAGYYRNLFKGYIGITIFLSLAGAVYDAVTEAIERNNPSGYFILVTVAAVPLLMVTFLLPASIYHEKRVAKQVPSLVKSLIEKSKIERFKATDLNEYLPKRNVAED